MVSNRGMSDLLSITQMDVPRNNYDFRIKVTESIMRKHKGEGIKKEVIVPAENTYKYVLNFMKIKRDNTRKREQVIARAVTTALISLQHKDITLAQIGKLIDKHHSSVIHFKKTMNEDYLKFNPPFNKVFLAIKKDLGIKRSFIYRENRI